MAKVTRVKPAASSKKVGNKKVTSERNKIVGAKGANSGQTPAPTKSSYQPRFIRPTKRG